MKVRARLVLAATWLAAMLLAVWWVSHSRFTTDLSFFLPSEPTPEQEVLVDQLREGVVSRLLMVAIEGGDARSRAQASHALRDRLAADPAFVSVQNGELGALDGELSVLMRHRYQLSPAVTADRFSVDGLRSAVLNTIDIVSSPAGLLLKPHFLRDPTGEVIELLSGLQSQGQPAMAEGVWSSRDGQRALLLLQTRALGADTDGQAQAVERVQQLFAEESQATPALSLQVAGPGVFAVQTRAAVKADVARLTLMSAAGISLLLWLVYRRPWPLLLTLVPVLSGALAGLVVVSLVHGSVFAITAGFGAALIGEAVDYGIYYFVQAGRGDLREWHSRFWPTIRLGVATSVLGFGALLFAGFPGLAQLGLYALSGVVTASLVTRFVLPAMAGQVQVRTPGLPPGFVGLVRRARALRWPVLLLGAIALTYLAMHRQALWEPNLSVLSSITEADAQRDTQLRSDLGAPDARYIVVVRAASRELALQGAELAGERLAPLVEQGRIGGFDSPARFLPSEALQSQRQASLPESQVLKGRLDDALAGQPISPARLAPFVAEVAQARTAPPLRRADLDGTALALAVDSLLQSHPSGWTALLPLRPVAGQGGSDLPAHELERALQGSGALFVDLKAEFEHMYADYLRQAIVLSLLGMVAIVALLSLTLRSARRLAAVLLPLVATVAVVMAGLHLGGARLHLLHLVGMLLIVAVGSNYALFLERWCSDPAADATSLLSVLVACGTTVIGFGALAMSAVPVLQAVGATVAPGALLALVFAAALAPRERAA
ncbi:MAG: MMPL family transporter [Hydrogenophaga sp.]|uniref:MMPL family transporter n=1 Tax=Hydrogenophaga sp. TaxID=1904254 RepID=UPI001DB43467|nr:MMPL family transporter [Hydrogenophaga sp.]MBX3609929.1 MMPL family transporter [Hydrogenophaga sp.]